MQFLSRFISSKTESTAYSQSFSTITKEVGLQTKSGLVAGVRNCESESKACGENCGSNLKCIKECSDGYQDCLGV